MFHVKNIFVCPIVDEKTFPNADESFTDTYAWFTNTGDSYTDADDSFTDTNELFSDVDDSFSNFYDFSRDTYIKKLNGDC